jgi:N-acetylmuramoyl-L-alanine amidase
MGVITQMVGEDLRAWHAGESSWGGETDINSHSIGIEIHNRGHSPEYAGFPAQQMDSVIALSRDIVRRNDIRPERVLAHSDVAPKRKIDPGEKFDWRKLHAAGVGHWVEPTPVGPPLSQIAEDKDAAASLQQKLGKYGYSIDITGSADEQTEVVVKAFQRHFRPERVDGIADRSTVDTLDRLLGALNGQ